MAFYMAAVVGISSERDVSICDWLWENPPVTHKDNYLEKCN